MNDWYAFIFKICGALCHQMPLRSFFIFGFQFPLCYRCTGLLVGTMVFLVLVYRQRLPALWLAIFLLLPMLIDVGLQHWGWWEGANALRLLTGVGFGAGMPVTVLKVLFRHDVYKRGLSHEAQSNR